MSSLEKVGPAFRPLERCHECAWASGLMYATVGSRQSYINKMIVNVDCKRLRRPCPHSFPLVSCALRDIVRVFAGRDASISWSWGSERQLEYCDCSIHNFRTGQRVLTVDKVALGHPNAYRNRTLLFTNQSPTLAQISVFYPVKIQQDGGLRKFRHRSFP
jgi:hypothetical protein